jgi:RNA polymerase sigma-32 factor
MMMSTAYLLDGRGRTTDGRRRVAAGEVVLDLDAVEPSVSNAEAAQEAAWTEAGSEDAAAAQAEEASAASRHRSASPSVDSYAAYMASLRHAPRFDRDEEHQLAVEYLKRRDPEIARQLVTANLKLVVKLAHEYTRAHRNLLDLIQEGNVGLVQAIEKYDPHRNVKLSSYAAWWIRAYMLRYILQNARIVRLGTTATQRKLFFNLRKEQAKLERMGFVPSAKNVAERLRVPEAEVLDMEQRLSAPDASLDAPVFTNGHDEPGRSRLDLVESPAWRPDVATEEVEFKERLHQVLEAFGSRLKGRERALFDERLISAEPRTLQELGDRFGISRERTRQLEMRLLARLKTYLASQLGDAVDVTWSAAHAEQPTK